MPTDRILSPTDIQIAIDVNIFGMVWLISRRVRIEKKTKIHEKRINNVMCQYSIAAANTDTRNRKRAMLCSMNITHTHVVKAHNLQKMSNMSMQDHLVVV